MGGDRQESERWPFFLIATPWYRYLHFLRTTESPDPSPTPLPAVGWPQARAHATRGAERPLIANGPLEGFVFNNLPCFFDPGGPPLGKDPPLQTRWGVCLGCPICPMSQKRSLLGGFNSIHRRQALYVPTNRHTPMFFLKLCFFLVCSGYVWSSGSSLGPLFSPAYGTRARVGSIPFIFKRLLYHFQLIQIIFPPGEFEIWPPMVSWPLPLCSCKLVLVGR